MKITEISEGYSILPPIDKERYTEIPGLEGPFTTKSGKVVYYDPKEGKYYDRDTDMYIPHDEYEELNKDSTSEGRNASNTEHSGAKKGKGGYWGRKKDAKSDSNKKRRTNDKKSVSEVGGPEKIARKFVPGYGKRKANRRIKDLDFDSTMYTDILDPSMSPPEDDPSVQQARSAISRNNQNVKRLQRIKKGNKPFDKNVKEADQVKAKEKKPKAKAGRSDHPYKERLVGEASEKNLTLTFDKPVAVRAINLIRNHLRKEVDNPVYVGLKDKYTATLDRHPSGLEVDIIDGVLDKFNGQYNIQADESKSAYDKIDDKFKKLSGGHSLEDREKWWKEKQAEIKKRKAETEKEFPVDVEEDKPRKNPVAKHMNTFNKAATHKDKKKSSKRGDVKHKNKQFSEEIQKATTLKTVTEKFTEL